MAAQPAVSLTEKRLFEAAARCVRIVTRGGLMLAATLFCVAIAGLACDVAMRYLLHSSIRGMQEIVNLLFIWIYMIGIAAMYARKGDAAITFIARALPISLQIVLASLVALGISASMSVVALETMHLIAAQLAIRTAELGLPEPLRFIPLVIAAACVAITSLIDFWSCTLWARFGVRPSIWPELLPSS